MWSLCSEVGREVGREGGILMEGASGAKLGHRRRANCLQPLSSEACERRQLPICTYRQHSCLHLVLHVCAFLCCLEGRAGGSDSRAVEKMAGGGSVVASPHLGIMHLHTKLTTLVGTDDDERSHDATHSVDMQSVDAGLTVHQVFGLLYILCVCLYKNNVKLMCLSLVVSTFAIV